MKRFSVRDLFWLTLLAAVLLVWWIDHQILVAGNRFTVWTVDRPNGNPTVLLDNVTGNHLYRDGDVWRE